MIETMLIIDIGILVLGIVALDIYAEPAQRFQKQFACLLLIFILGSALAVYMWLQPAVYYITRLRY